MARPDSKRTRGPFPGARRPTSARPNAARPGGGGEGAAAAEGEWGGHVEWNRREAPPPRFLGESVADAGAADRAHDGKVGPRRGGGEREDRAVGAVQRRALPQVEDRDHDRAASSR